MPSSVFAPTFPSEQLATKDSPLAVTNATHSLYIGVPKEISLQESRVGLTPEAVELLVQNGHRVLVEQGAGIAAKFTDEQYRLAGAEVVSSPQEVFEADIILKIEPLIEDEFTYLKPGKALFSTLNIPTLSKSYFDKLLKKKVIGLAFETLEDKVGNLPVIRAMSEIAGNTVMLIAAEYLSSVHGGKGMIMGGVTGVPPTNVVIIGAGTVAEFATRAALGLGADVKVFDVHIYRLQRLKYAIGQHLFTAIIDSHTLPQALKDADVVIGAMRSDQTISPLIVTEEMVANMKPGSVLIDVSIDQGGCFETSQMTTHKEPIFRKHDVIHYCVPNIASRVAHTASIALSNIFTPILLKIGRTGGIEEMTYQTSWFNKGIYCYKGSMTNYPIAQRFQLRYRDIGLLLAARI